MALVYYPVSENCPGCDSRKFKRVRDRESLALALTTPRECKKCGVRYTPPVPKWALYLSIATGILVMVASATGVSIILTGSLSRHLGPGLNLLLFCLVGFATGVGVIAIGITQLMKREYKKKKKSRRKKRRESDAPILLE